MSEVGGIPAADVPISRWFTANMQKRQSAGAAVVYTPPKWEAGQAEGSGGGVVRGGRLVQSPPLAAVFFLRFLLGKQKKSDRRRHLAAEINHALP